MDRREDKRKERWGGGGPCAIRSCLCFCLYACSHTVEINLPSGLSLWNKERRKLARSDTLREMERDKTGTVRRGGFKEKCR